MYIFEDRKDAGCKLSKKLEHYKKEKPIILAMPRGGVVLGYEIAKELHAVLDVIVARKIGAPLQPELAIGAIAPGDIVVLNEELMHYFNLNDEDIKKLVDKEKTEMNRRIKTYRGDAASLNLEGKIVIIVDDGLATGLTALAAIRSVRKLKPKKIILAIGACAFDSAREIKKEVDELICLLEPMNFYAVGQWYRHFDQVTDEEVITLLKGLGARIED